MSLMKKMMMIAIIEVSRRLQLEKEKKISKIYSW